MIRGLDVIAADMLRDKSVPWWGCPLGRPALAEVHQWDEAALLRVTRSIGFGQDKFFASAEVPIDEVRRRALLGHARAVVDTLDTVLTECVRALYGPEPHLQKFRVFRRSYRALRFNGWEPDALAVAGDAAEEAGLMDWAWVCRNRGRLSVAERHAVEMEPSRHSRMPTLVTYSDRAPEFHDGQILVADSDNYAPVTLTWRGRP